MKHETMCETPDSRHCRALRPVPKRSLCLNSWLWSGGGQGSGQCRPFELRLRKQHSLGIDFDGSSFSISILMGSGGQLNSTLYLGKLLTIAYMAPTPQLKNSIFGPAGPRDPLRILGRIGGNRSPLFPSKSVVIGPILGRKTVWPMYALVYPDERGPKTRASGSL